MQWRRCRLKCGVMLKYCVDVVNKGAWGMDIEKMPNDMQPQIRRSIARS